MAVCRHRAEGGRVLVAAAVAAGVLTLVGAAAGAPGHSTEARASLAGASGVRMFPGRPFGPTGLACESATRCLAVGDNSVGVAEIAPIVAGRPGAPPVGTEQQLEAIACADASCTVAGANSSQRAIVGKLSGVTARTVPVGHGLFGLGSLGCATSSSCVAGGDGQGVIVSISSGAPSAITPLSALAFVNGIACPTATVCWAVGDAHANPHHGLLVRIDNDEPGVVHHAPSMYLSGIACATATSCEATGSVPSGAGHEGVVVRIVDGRFGAPRRVPGTSFMSAIACPTTRCLAIGNTPPRAGRSKGVVLAIHNGTPSATRSIPVAPTLLACPTSRVCEAVGSTDATNARGYVISLRLGG